MLRQRTEQNGLDPDKVSAITLAQMGHARLVTGFGLATGLSPFGRLVRSRFLLGLRRLLIGVGGLLVGIAAVVRDVESGPAEQDAAPRPNQPPQFRLAALGALALDRVMDSLE